MFLCSLPLRASYRNSAIAECAQLLITKRPVEFDYVAVDVSALVSSALRIPKGNVNELRHHRDVARNVAHSVQQVLQKVQCRNSLLLALDGAETFVKAATMRRQGGGTRKIMNRWTRLPGTLLMQLVEERVVKMLPNSRITPAAEVTFCGTCVAGSVEEKMTSWALDLACRRDHDGNARSLCLIGPTDLFYTTIGLTPYYNVCNLVQISKADMRQLRLQDLLEWLHLDELAGASGGGATVASARTDALFLYLLCHGYGSADLPAVSGLSFASVFERYRARILQPCLSLGQEGDGSRGSGAEAGDRDGSTGFLFTDAPGGTLQLDLTRLLDLLSGSVSPPTRQKLEQLKERETPSGSYLEHVLQVHTSLCLGRTPDPLFMPSYLDLEAPAVSLQHSQKPGITSSQLLAHLVALNASGCCSSTAGVTAAASAASVPDGPIDKSLAADSSSQHQRRAYSPFWSPTQPLTAAEYTLLSHSIQTNVELLMHHYVRTVPKLELTKAITQARISTAHRMVQEALALTGPENTPHQQLRHNQLQRTLYLAPSYTWRQDQHSKLWGMRYVDLGERGRGEEIRRVRSTAVGAGMTLGASSDAPAVFDANEQQWRCIAKFPLVSDDDAGSQDTSDAATPFTLKLLTWNVMFDRYSGQPTPLGMPGIDWCTPQRYPVLARLIAAEQADVVGMQEVEPAFAEYLAAQPWCRENYVMSCLPGSSVLSPWGVLMLVHRRRMRVTRLTHMNIPAWSGHVSLMPVVAIEMPWGALNVAATHLLAPFTKSSETARTTQDSALRQHMVKAITGDCVVMGDFNDWPTNEFSMPPETHYAECWPLVHPRQLGFTMDDSNTFCKLKIEEMFFGRSDKMFMRSPHMRPIEAHLVGTKSVNTENGSNEAPSYLFPSDHYGVSMTFART